MKTQAGFALTSRLFVAAAALLVLLACCAIPNSLAFAEGFSGALTGAVSFDVDKAQFAATGTGSVFVNVKDGDRYVAQGLQTSIEKDASVLTLEKFNPNKAYAVEFASSPRGKAEYAGAIAPVFAQYGETDTQLMAVRTAIDGTWAAVSAPATRIVDGSLYRLVSTEGKQDADGALTFEYAVDSSVTNLNDVTGTVTYMDMAGEAVRVDRIPNFLASKGYEVPSVVHATISGQTYTFEVLGLRQGETRILSSDSGQIDFVVPVRVLRVNQAEGQYNATIKYVDQETGATLIQDALLVNKIYRYTVPEEFYQCGKDGKVQVYRLDAAFAQNPIELMPGDDPQKTVVEVPYHKVASDESLTWTVRFVNGADGANSTIAPEATFEVQPGATMTYQAKPITVDGVTYYPAGVPEGSSKECAYTYGDSNLVTTVYYVPAGFEAPAYQVVVNYVNLADNSILGTMSMTADPSMTEDLMIQGPEQLNVDGKQYVRLAGQEQAKRHNFYSNQRTYTVYYRDVNDDLLAQTTVYETVVTRTTRVEPGTTIYVAGAGTATDTGATAAGNQVANTTLNDNGGTVNAVAGAGDQAAGQQVTGGAYANDGQPAHETGAVIEDDATPLASGQSANQPQSVPTGAIVCGAVAAIALLTLILLLLNSRKRSDGQNGGVHNA